MSSRAITAASEAAILARLIEPERDNMLPEAACYLLSIDFRDEDRDRMNALAEKAREGALTEDEGEELENYRRVSHLLALMQSKARISLRASGQ